jgi:tetratricopeptide (TPR) repeat protein
MISRLTLVCVGLLVAACWNPAPIAAQGSDGASGSSTYATPPENVPRAQRGDRTRNLDFLFDALKAAPDAESAKALETRIWAIWSVSGSDTCDLLMARTKQAIEAKDIDLSIRLLNAIIEIRPSFVEAWNRRATMFFLKKDYSNALADIERVLAHEPRHFGALSGLGTIMEELGDNKRALEAFRKALAIHPRLPGVTDQVKELTLKVEGRDI